MGLEFSVERRCFHDRVWFGSFNKDNDNGVRCHRLLLPFKEVKLILKLLN